MSFDEQNLEAFIELLTHKRSRLFTPEDIANLAKLIDRLPDDIEKLSVAIADWYQKRPKILDAQLDLLNNLSTTRTTFDRIPTAKVGEIQTPDNPLNKQALQNAIQPTSKPTK